MTHSTPSPSHAQCSELHIESKNGDAWNIIAISAEGEPSRKRGSPRQDAFSFGEVNGWLYAAVADGLGSEDLSHIGATQAVTSVRNALHRTTNEITAQTVKTILDQAKADINTLARTCNAIPTKLATTLDFILINQTLNKAYHGATGDCRSWIIRENGNVEQLGEDRPKPTIGAYGLHENIEKAAYVTEITEPQTVAFFILHSDGLNSQFMKQTEAAPAPDPENIKMFTELVKSQRDRNDLELDIIMYLAKHINAPNDEDADDRTLVLGQLSQPKKETPPDSHDEAEPPKPPTESDEATG